jgi:hypothetical protein
MHKKTVSNETVLKLVGFNILYSITIFPVPKTVFAVEIE